MHKKDEDKAHIDTKSLVTSPSGLALQCRVYVKNEAKLVWIPLSLIDDDSEVWKPAQEGELVIPLWFAIKEGLV